MSMPRKLISAGRFLTALLLKRPFPLAVQIALTNQCNYCCAYCRYYERDHQDPPADKVYRLIREFVALGTQRFSFTGGEVLLRRDVGDILKYTRSLGASTSIISNGYLVPKKLDLLQWATDICISIDGPEAVMDANRHPDSFKHAIRACNVLKAAGIYFRIGCVITKNNATIENIHFLLRLAESYGTRCSFLVVQTVLETSGSIDSLYAQHQAVETCLDEIISAHKNGGAILFSRNAYELARKWPDFSKPRIIKAKAPLNGYPQCWAGRFFCNVDTDGIVYPCCLTIGEVAGISAYEVGVRQALDQAARHNCSYCMSPGWIDYNQIFSLNPHALWHAFRYGHI